VTTCQANWVGISPSLQDRSSGFGSVMQLAVFDNGGWESEGFIYMDLVICERKLCTIRNADLSFGMIGREASPSLKWSVLDAIMVLLPTVQMRPFQL
jgi:hypothetical protein